MLTTCRSALAVALVASSALAAVPAHADETDKPADLTVTGSVTAVTDYRFRGVSHSAGDPAIQGTINLNHSSGLYVGAWSSSIDFDHIGLGPVYGSEELDLYGGLTREVAPGLTADVGLLYYAYPGGHIGKAEFFEPYGSLASTIGPAKVKVGFNYAWKQDALFNDDNLYLYTNVDVGIPNTPLTMSGHLGYQDGPLAAPFATGFSNDKTALDYSLGASATVLGKLTIGVSYVGVEGPKVKGFTDDTVVGSLSLAF